MNNLSVLVIGGGGREQCLAWKISQSPMVAKIYCAPGNGGTYFIPKSENVDISDSDIDKLLAFAIEHKIDLTVVGPELPLTKGLVDKFQANNLKVFGPQKELAMLEGSKAFAKELMRKYNVPTAAFRVFTDSKEARDYVKTVKLPVVIKADGLAAGKGVIICSTQNEALGAIDLMMEERIFGKAGDKIVIEECLTGEEVSLLVVTDGKTIIPLVPSQDHKRAFDNDAGPNTGGMGAYAPVPLADEGVITKVINKVFWPLIDGLRKEGKPYKGILYAGLMIKNKEPQVLEFNVRFGDPETQVIVPKIKSDLVEIMLRSIEDNGLMSYKIEWDERYCVCVVLASGGYPGNYEKGKLIAGLEKASELEDVHIFHAGTKLESAVKEGGETPEEKYVRTITGKESRRIVTTGGRVLNIVAFGMNLIDAQNKVYKAIADIKFDKMQYRKDIGSKAIKTGVN